jgi:hypothetical protein
MPDEKIFPDLAVATECQVPKGPGTGRGAVMFDDMARVALLGIAVLIFFTFQDYGITTDEEVQNVYGIKLLSFYTSFFSDDSAFQYIDLYRYGGFFDLLAAIVNLVSPIGEYETRHLLGGLIGVVGLAAAWRLGRLLGGRRVGFLALLLLLLTPAYYGQSFNNPKDGPFAAAMLWTIYYLCRVFASLPRPPTKTVVKFGVALGIALGIRVAAVLVGPYLLVGITLYLLAEWRSVRDPLVARAHLLSMAGRLLPAAVIAYAIMGICWPWGVMNPLNPFQALHDFANYQINLDTLVSGIWVKAAHLPRDYLPDYLVVNLPEIVLFGLIIAGGAGASWLVRRLQSGLPVLIGTGRQQMLHMRLLLVVLAAFFPVVFFIFFRPTAYNGIRHFLFVVPPMAVLAAIGVDKAWCWSERTHPVLGQVFAAVLTAVVVAQGWVMGQLHPDEYVYYNLLTGGVKGAEGAYELDYWGNSLLEATKDLAEYIAMENGDKPITRTYKVAVCGHRLSAAYFFPEYMEYTRKVGESDFLIAFTQANCNRQFEGRQIISVDRFGVALSVVKDRRYLKNRDK